MHIVGYPFLCKNHGSCKIHHHVYQWQMCCRTILIYGCYLHFISRAENVVFSVYNIGGTDVLMYNTDTKIGLHLQLVSKSWRPLFKKAALCHMSHDIAQYLEYDKAEAPSLCSKSSDGFSHPAEEEVFAERGATSKPFVVSWYRNHRAAICDQLCLVLPYLPSKWPFLFLHHQS